MPAIEVTSNEHFSSLVGKGVVVLDFWAEWCKPCVPMNATFDQLSSNYPSVKFLKIDAENLSDITEKYDVSSVPTFVFLKDGKVLDKVAGANGPDLVSKLSKYGSETTTTTTAASSTEDIKSRLEKLVNFAPVMLFMKGTPEQPQCGFSNKISDILKKNNVKFSSFNILSDDEVRQALKEYSNWPTYPQLYVEGKLIGGLDIVKEMAEDGDLDSVIPASARGSSPSSSATTATSTTTTTVTEPKEDLNTRLVKLINKESVMLFMKGNPEAPKCGFSGKIVEILKSTGAKYGSFDILSDEEVRNGLKAYSNWPTYPQLYVKGKLVGGLDIVKEMAEEGELKDLLAA